MLVHAELNSAQINFPLCFAVLCSNVTIHGIVHVIVNYLIEYTLQQGYSEDSAVRIEVATFSFVLIDWGYVIELYGFMYLLFFLNFIPKIECGFVEIFPC